jgi:hypothetical protein
MFSCLDKAGLFLLGDALGRLDNCLVSRLRLALE